MKRYLFVGLLSLLSHQFYAQTDCVFPLTTYIPQQTSPLPESAANTLESKLRQIVTQNGLDGNLEFAPFAVIANISEASKEVIAGTRPTVALTFDLELYVENTFTGDKFGSVSVRLSGAGFNEAKAYSSAFSRLSATNTKLQSFLKDTKTKIIAYYESQTPMLTKQANLFATQGKYEEAFALLSSVPLCCSQYSLAEETIVNIFTQYINYDCAAKVMQAQAAWNASQDKAGAMLAGAYLTAIHPASACTKEVNTLMETISKRIGDDWEFYKELKRGDVALKDKQIEAAKAIGVAYGTHQQAHTITENTIVR